MSEPEKISYSQISCYKRCKKRWYYKYVKKLYPIYTARPFMMGRLIHKGIELYHGGEDWRQGLFEMHQKNLYEIRGSQSLSEEIVAEYADEAIKNYEDAVELMERYVEHDQRDPLIPEGWKVLATEEKFLVDLEGAKDRLYGFIDMIVEDPYGNIWGVEHKSGEQFFDVDQLSLNEQTTMYIGVLKCKYGVDRVKGMIYNLIRTKKPTIPRLTKQGTMSRAAIDTTWEIYERELLKHGLNPADYEDMKAKLENVKFFDRTYVYRTNAEINNFFREVVIVMNELSDQREDMCYRNPTKDCSWDCREYNELCIMEFKGLDVESYIERAFLPKRKEDIHLDEDEDIPIDLYERNGHIY